MTGGDEYILFNLTYNNIPSAAGFPIDNALKRAFVSKSLANGAPSQPFMNLIVPSDTGQTYEYQWSLPANFEELYRVPKEDEKTKTE